MQGNMKKAEAEAQENAASAQQSRRTP